ncbi:TonB family protein [Nitrospina gracilis]|nr:TonB family protein [Nitrospina gracilis]
MSTFKNLTKSFNLFHAIGFSVATHLVLLIFLPALPANTTIKLENKFKKVRLEIIKRSRPPQVHKKKSMPIMKKAVLKTTTQTLPKSIHIKPLRTSFAQPVSLKPASKFSVSRKTSPSARQLNAAFVPISRSRNNEVSSMPYAKRAVSGMGYSNLLHDFKVVRKVSSFSPSSNMQAGRAVRVSTRSFSSLSFAPAVRVVKSIKEIFKVDSVLQTGDEFKEIWGRYTNSIQLRIAQSKIYPPLARERKQQGKVFLSFKLDKEGEILELSVENSSGHKILDQAAIKAIKEAAPFPNIPASLNKNYASLKIPISFILR